jgi:hypothetical protein
MFRNRTIERRRRPDGKFDLVVTFFTGMGDSRRTLSEYVAHEAVGPRQAVKLAERLDVLLGAAYLQGKNNQSEETNR